MHGSGRRPQGKAHQRGSRPALQGLTSEAACRQAPHHEYQGISHAPALGLQGLNEAALQGFHLRRAGGNRGWGQAVSRLIPRIASCMFSRIQGTGKLRAAQCNAVGAAPPDWTPSRHCLSPLLMGWS